VEGRLRYRVGVRDRADGRLRYRVGVRDRADGRLRYRIGVRDRADGRLRCRVGEERGQREPKEGSECRQSKQKEGRGTGEQ
jgi:hypothetical protein